MLSPVELEAADSSLLKAPYRMKLLLYGSQKAGSNNISFVRAFEQLGVQVYCFDDETLYERRLNRFGGSTLPGRVVNRMFHKQLSAPLQRMFEAQAADVCPDIVLIIKGYYLKPSTIERIQRAHPLTKVVCFNPDNPFNTWQRGSSNEWIRASIPLYEWYFIWGKFLIEPLRRAGARQVEYLPFAYDPELRYPVNLVPEEHERFGADVAFVGGWDEEREYWLNALADFDLKIWGDRWNRANRRLRAKWQGREAYGEDFAKVCAASKININLVRKQNVPGHNMRTFEVPACGGFLLGTRTTEQVEFFSEDREMAYFSTTAELAAKVRYYLADEQARTAIARSGCEKVRMHTFRNRAARILDYLQMGPASARSAARGAGP